MMRKAAPVQNALLHDRKEHELAGNMFSVVGSTLLHGHFSCCHSLKGDRQRTGTRQNENQGLALQTHHKMPNIEIRNGLSFEWSSTARP